MTSEIIAKIRAAVAARRPAAESPEAFEADALYLGVVARLAMDGETDEIRAFIEEIYGPRPARPAPDEASPEPRPSFVYFLRANPSGRIKIGRASDVEKRIDTLQQGSPERLTLLLAIPGDKDTERSFHREFAAHRIVREWFLPVPELLDRIERLASEASAT